MDGLRLTIPLLLVLRVLLAGPASNHWGFEIMKATGLASGTVYPLLFRLEAMGWVESVLGPGGAVGSSSAALLPPDR